MNSFINDSFKQNNMEDINKRVNRIKQKLIKKGYFQSNINKKVPQRNNINNEQNKISYIYDEKSKNNNYSKSMNEIDNSNKTNFVNDKKENDNQYNIKLNKRKMNQGLNKPKGKEYIFNMAMSNLNKYKDNLVIKKNNCSNSNNTKLLKQIYNKKNSNSMVNCSIINPAKYNFNSYNDISTKNNFYNIDNDINNENEKYFPLPEPTPIKINKSSKYINHMINSSMHLNDNSQRNSSFNCLNNSNYNKYFNLNDNKNYIIPNNINNINSEILKDDYYFGNSLNSFYNKAFNTERERDKINQNKNFSEERNNSNKDCKNNSNDDYKLIFILKNLNLDYLINVFKMNYVSFNDLFLLTKDDLKEMKIPIGPRNKIIHFIEQYKKQMKSLELDEISNFLIIYKNILSPKPYPPPQMTENNINSTMPTTNNEVSNKVKDNSNNNIFLYNDTFSNENKGENSQDINYHRKNEFFNINEKQNKNEYIKNNINNNYSFLNSFNHKRESFDKNNIHVHKRNSSVLRNLKASSYINPRYNSSISINKKKLKSPKNKDKSQNNSNTNKKTSHNQKNKKINKKNELKSSINKIKQKQNNHKCYYRNVLNSTYNKKNEQSFNIPKSERLYNCKINDNDILHNSMVIKNSNNKRQKLFKQNAIKKDRINLRKNNSNLSLNIKMKNNDTYYLNNINNKIIECFKSLNKEVEMFQTQYKKLKKESFDREKKIKNLLLGENKISGKIESSKQQIKDSDLHELKSEYDNENDIDLNFNSHSEITKNKNLVLRNVCQNKNNHIFNNNLSNSKSNTLIYELDIENES